MFIVMERIYAIEQGLLQLDGATLQNLVDSFMELEYNPIALSSIGVQVGARQTTKGTPDTAYMLEDGTLYYCETTKQKEDLLAKLVADVSKCIALNASLLVKPASLNVSLFFLGKLKVSEMMQLKKYCDDNSVTPQIIGIDILKNKICFKYPGLAKEYLGIPISSGQFISLPSFVKNYSTKTNKIATPIDNLFIGREKELVDITSKLESNNLLVISGQPGVGKTRLAVEAMKEYKKRYKKCHLYAFSENGLPISSDLSYIDKDAIILIDDAGETDNLKSLLKWQASKKEDNVKIILTTRAYLFQQVYEISEKYDPETISIEKMTSDEVEKIISSEPFCIRHFEYKTKILALAEGNPRLAVMCARVALAEGSNFLVNNVADIYDRYFEKYSKSVETRCWASLGLLSFFKKLPLAEKEPLNSILRPFNINFCDFITDMQMLNRKELVDIQYEQVVISDQIFAAYCFYRVFVKEKILNFDVLFENFYKGYSHSFMNSLYSIYNAYDHQIINEIVIPVTEKYLSLHTEDKDLLVLFDVFWYIIPNRVLEFLCNRISALNNPDEEVVYSTDYGRNAFVSHKDPYLNLCAKFFVQSTTHLPTVLMLSFEYCRKRPETLSQLAYHLKETMGLSPHDDSYCYYRQKTLVQTILDGLHTKNEDHLIKLFFFVSQELLRFEFRSNFSKGAQYVIYTMNLPEKDDIVSLRKMIWEEIIIQFHSHKTEVVDLLYDYLKNYGKNNNVALKMDWPFLKVILETCLSSRDLEQTILANRILDNKIRKDPYYSNLKLRKKYFTKDFRYYVDIANLKADNIPDHFIIRNEKEIRKIIYILGLVEKRKESHFSLSFVLDNLVSANYRVDKQTGIKLFVRLYNVFSGFNPMNLSYIAQEESRVFRSLWKYLDKSLKRRKYSLLSQLLNWAYSLNNIYDDLLYDLIGHNEECIWLTPSIISRSGNPIELLKTIYSTNEARKGKIEINEQTFEAIGDWENNERFVIDLYLQQCLISRKKEYDYHGDAFASIYSKAPCVLYETVKTVYFNDEEMTPKDLFCVIWDDPICQAEIYRVLDLLCSKIRYLTVIDEEAIGLIFPYGLNEKQKKYAANVLLEYAKTNYGNVDRLNCVLFVLRTQYPQFMDSFVAAYLSHDPTVNEFKKLSWTPNHQTYWGDETAGNIDKQRWQNIKSLFERYNKSFNTASILVYIQKQIEYCEKEDLAEKSRNFGYQYLW